MPLIGRQFVAIALIAVMTSTALTAIVWMRRNRDPLHVVTLRGPKSIFRTEPSSRVVTIAVSPGLDEAHLEFRFRCLLERDPPPGIRYSSAKDVDSSIELIKKIPGVRSRLETFDSLNLSDYVGLRDVAASNIESHRVVLADFGKVYSILFDPKHQNESLTTFALLLNATGGVVGYFEGYAEFFTAQEYLLDYLEIESPGGKIEFVEDPQEGQSSISHDLPAFGEVTLGNVAKDRPYGVTFLIKDKLHEVTNTLYRTHIETARYLEILETYLQGEWIEKASGYWIIKCTE